MQQQGDESAIGFWMVFLLVLIVLLLLPLLVKCGP